MAGDGAWILPVPVTVKRPRREGEPSPPWCTGRAPFLSLVDVHGFRLIVAVDGRFGAVARSALALLDTAAEWSMVGGAWTEALAEEADPPSEALLLRTRVGAIAGHLHRLPVTLLADEGEHLVVPATALRAPSWPGPPVLGYRGLLERIRFRLDPGAGAAEPWISFSVAS